MSIIIPYHNEDINLLVPLFSSINTQIEINFDDIEIIMTNNCEEPKQLEDFFNRYSNINKIIRYIECPIKGGMGTNRQFGLEQSIGEYVMFCDCDDVLYSPSSLALVFSKLTTDIDMYDFIAIKELDIRELQPGAPLFEINGPNPVLLHGKVYRRDYLSQHHIGFTNRLFAWEDMFFNQSLEMTKPNRKYFKIPIYVWKFRASSVSKELGPEIVYQMKHWKDGILKNYYVFDYIRKYNTHTDEDFYDTFCATVADWYARRYENSYRIIDTNNMYAFTILTFDPTLVHLKQYSTQQIGEESFIDWVKRITHNVDAKKMAEIDKKFNIGHLEDFCY